MKAFIIVIFQLSFLLIWTNSYAVKYQTVKDGNWNSSSTWGGSVPSYKWSMPIDTIVINNVINYNTDNSVVYAHIIINVAGALNSTSKNLEIGNSASMVNYGSISIHALSTGYGTFSILNYGSIALSSTFIINTGSFVNQGTFTSTGNTTNTGIFSNSGNYTTAGFTTSSQFTNSGILTTSENFINNYSATGSNSGTMNIGKDFNNYNIFSNSGTINVGGVFLNNYNTTYTNLDGSSLNVTGNLTNNSRLLNAGNIDINGSALNNYGSSISNTGTLDIAGPLANNNVISSDNVLIIGGTVTNNYNSTITNQGEMIVSGNISNNSVINNSGELLVSGTVVNSSVNSTITGAGSLCNPNGITDPTNGNTSNISNSICTGDAVALPVELIDFKGVIYNNKYLLSWKTASETNNDFYTIFFSVDGKSFKEIAKIKGKGTTSQLSSYTFSFQDENTSTKFFRIMQTDFDGRSKVLKTISINTKSALADVSVYPNPVHQQDVLHVNLPESENQKIFRMSDIRGNIVAVENTNSTDLEINTSEFKAGLYFVNILIDGIQYSFKLQIL